MRVLFGICMALFFITGCMTSSRRDELQSTIAQSQVQVNQLQNQINSCDQQINNTTKSFLASQSDVQNIQNQLQLSQGAVDELKVRIKKIEESAGSSSSTNDQNVASILNNSEIIALLQRQVARLNLITYAKLSFIRKGKLPTRIKNDTQLTKTLKENYNTGKFKETIDLAASVLGASDSTPAMLVNALFYRGQSRFQLKDYRGAAIDLSTLVEMFPSYPSYALALLLTGDSYVYLRNNVMAYSYYQECALKNSLNAPEGKACAERLTGLSAQTTKNN